MPIAHLSASRAEANASMNPSPCDFTSKPSCIVASARTSSLCSARSDIHSLSPRRSVSSVDPSMSVKRIVAVPFGAVAEERSGRSCSTSTAIRSIDPSFLNRSIAGPWTKSFSSKSWRISISPSSSSRFVGRGKRIAHPMASSPTRRR